MTDLVCPEAPLTILDGGTGSELMDRLKAMKVEIEFDGSWSAGMMLQCPEILKDVHLDYLRAGSRVITTNTYSVTPLVAEALQALF